MKRLFCWLFGHRIEVPTYGVEQCQRCWADRIYGETPFSALEVLGIVRCCWRAFKFWALGLWPWAKCCNCGRRYLWREGDGPACSGECDEQQVPF